MNRGLTRSESGNGTTRRTGPPRCSRHPQMPGLQGLSDAGRLCQQCKAGTICLACQPYWTWN